MSEKMTLVETAEVLIRIGETFNIEKVQARFPNDRLEALADGYAKKKLRKALQRDDSSNDIVMLDWQGRMRLGRLSLEDETMDLRLGLAHYLTWLIHLRNKISWQQRELRQHADNHSKTAELMRAIDSMHEKIFGQPPAKDTAEGDSERKRKSHIDHAHDLRELTWVIVEEIMPMVCDEVDRLLECVEPAGKATETAHPWRKTHTALALMDVRELIIPEIPTAQLEELPILKRALEVSRKAAMQIAVHSQSAKYLDACASDLGALREITEEVK